MRLPRHIGRKLFEAMRWNYVQQVFTVNSSTAQGAVCRYLGFTLTDTEQLTNGLR